MIKRYNQFVKEKVNEGVEDEFDTNQQESDLANRDLDAEFTADHEEDDPDTGETGRFGQEESEEEQPEEEGGDLYTSRLQELADKLGTDVVNGKIEFLGKKIIFPSETEMYHVGNKKFKTSDEVVAFFDKEKERLADQEADEMNTDEIMRQREEEDVRDLELQESKSYKETRRSSKKRGK